MSIKVYRYYRLFMSKKFIPFLLAAAFALLPPVAALAQERGENAAPARGGQAQNIRERAPEQNQNLRDQAQEKRATAKTKLDERRAQNIRKFFAKMGRRLEAAISRLEKMAEKIASRIQKFEERGGNVSEAKAKLEAARAKIAQARVAYDDAKAKLENALKSDTPKDAFNKVREVLVKGVVEKIKEAHRALVEAVRALKGTGLGEGAKATSTSSQ